MIIIGKVLGIFSAREKSTSILRPSVASLNLIINHGIEHDRYAGKNPSRAVMLIGKRAYDIAKEHHIHLISGSFGENILTDFDPHDFTEGMVIGIGDTKLRITESCNICKHLSVYDEKLPELVQYHRGVYCEILNEGIITKEQIIYIAHNEG